MADGYCIFRKKKFQHWDFSKKIVFFLCNYRNISLLKSAGAVSLGGRGGVVVVVDDAEVVEVAVFEVVLLVVVAVSYPISYFCDVWPLQLGLLPQRQRPLRHLLRLLRLLPLQGYLHKDRNRWHRVLSK